MKTISVVTTAFNEEPNIASLVKQVFDVFETFEGFDCEMVIVDNGSVDNTAQEVSKYIKQGFNITLLVLSRNFGYQGGVDAGLCHASGDWAFVIDADLQDPPELLPKMIKSYFGKS